MARRRSRAAESENIEPAAGHAPSGAEGSGEPLRVEIGALEVSEAQRLMNGVEAIVLSLERPVPVVRLAEALFHPARLERAREEGEDEGTREPKASAAEIQSIRAAVNGLNEIYAKSGRTFRIAEVAGGFRMMTQPEFAEFVALFRHSRISAKLSKAAVETLAIIAYRQPVTRAELEAIRGVACGEVLKSLMERRLITIAGRAEELGRPILYATAKAFLDHFGLASLKDLPSPSELKAGT